VLDQRRIILTAAVTMGEPVGGDAADLERALDDVFGR
jgi:hypothetical protein